MGYHQKLLDQMLPRSELEHNHLYRIHARNAEYGIWDAHYQSSVEPKGAFLVVRSKWGDVIPDHEHYYEDHPHYGTAVPLEDLGEHPDLEYQEYRLAVLRTLHEFKVKRRSLEDAENRFWVRFNQGNVGGCAGQFDAVK